MSVRGRRSHDGSRSSKSRETPHFAARARRLASLAMATYLLEAYQPATAGEIEAAAARLEAAALELAQEGVAVRYVRSVFVPGDETALHFLEAPAAEVARRVSERAAVTHDRIVETQLPNERSDHA